MRHWYLYLFLMNWLLAFWIPHPQSLDLLWSLAVEEQFYLLWPFAVYWLSEFAIGWLACGLLLLAPVLRWTCTPMFDSAWPIYALTPFRMDLLAAGALLSIAWRHHRDKIERFGPYGLLVSVGSCGALYLMSRHGNFTTHSNTVSTNVWVYEMSLFACTGVIVWALSGRGVQMLRWAPVAYVGRISYSIYLIHTTILFEILGHFGISVLMRAALGALGSVAYAALSWKFLEGPLLKNRREQTEETVRAY